MPACIRLRRQRRGNVAITFALALIPLLAFVGVAIDYSRANAVKADLQAALDSVALMVAKNAATMTADQLQSTAQSYFLALFNNKQASNINFTASYATSGGSTLVVGGSADVATSFMSLFGFNKTVTGSSTSKWGSTRLRVALVLDTTGSMDDDNKIEALKTATKNLLTQLKSAVSGDGDVYVSIIPFSKDVNVDGANSDAIWAAIIDARADIALIRAARWNVRRVRAAGCYNSTTYSCTGSSCSCTGHSYCSCSGYGSYRTCRTASGYYEHAWIKNAHSTWNGCVTDRGTSIAPGTSAGYDQNITAPSTGVPATLFMADQYRH